MAIMLFLVNHPSDRRIKPICFCEEVYFLSVFYYLKMEGVMEKRRVGRPKGSKSAGSPGYARRTQEVKDRFGVDCYRLWGRVGYRASGLNERAVS